MEELVNKVSDQAGINPEQAKSAVSTVLEFIKTKIPGVGEQIAGVLGGGAGDMIESARKKLGV